MGGVFLLFLTQLKDQEIIMDGVQRVGHEAYDALTEQTHRLRGYVEGLHEGMKGVMETGQSDLQKVWVCIQDMEEGSGLGQRPTDKEMSQSITSEVTGDPSTRNEAIRRALSRIQESAQKAISHAAAILAGDKEVDKVADLVGKEEMIVQAGLIEENEWLGKVKKAAGDALGAMPQEGAASAAPKPKPGGMLGKCAIA